VLTSRHFSFSKAINLFHLAYFLFWQLPFCQPLVSEFWLVVVWYDETNICWKPYE